MAASMKMFQDIVFPDNNENNFIETAKKLGTKSLIFVYDYIDKKTLEKLRLKISKIKDFKADIGILADEKSIVKLNAENEIIIFCKNPARKLVENKKTYVLYDFENQERPDFMHHRNSGLNQVLCNIMKEKEKVIGFSFNSVLNSKNPEIVIGRMKQNAGLAKKYKLKNFTVSFASQPNELRAKHEIESFKKILGI